jgi:hypothetical protein
MDLIIFAMILVDSPHDAQFAARRGILIRFEAPRLPASSTGQFGRWRPLLTDANLAADIPK